MQFKESANEFIELFLESLRHHSLNQSVSQSVCQTITNTLTQSLTESVNQSLSQLGVHSVSQSTILSVYHSVNQPFHQSTILSINHSVNQPFSQLTIPSVNHSVSPPLSQSVTCKKRQIPKRLWHSDKITYDKLGLLWVITANSVCTNYKTPYTISCLTRIALYNVQWTIVHSNEDWVSRSNDSLFFRFTLDICCKPQTENWTAKRHLPNASTCFKNSLVKPHRTPGN